MWEMESENQDDFMFMRIVAMFKIVITITINKHQVHDVSFYLKGLSLVPSSEGFTITAFLPAYLMYNNCVTHTAQAYKDRFEFRQRDLTKNGKNARSWTNLPESSRTTLPPFMIFPMTTSERNSILRSRLNQDFNEIPSKTLGGAESDKITFICPSLTWSSSGRTPAPYPRTK